LSKKKIETITGVDIGTTKICAIIGTPSDDGKIDIIGIGTCQSRGLRKGVGVNIDSTVESIRQAVQEAELMAGVTVDSVYAGIAGGHIKGFNSRGVVAVSSKSHEVSQSDIDRVIDAARAVAIPMDREVIHIIPQEYIIDDQDGIKKPLGMSGVRLEAEVHIVTGAVTSAQNIIKSVSNAGLEVKDIVLEQIASAEATLSQDEKDLGTILVDIGGGTTDIALFVNGAIWHTAVLSLGGDHFTNDISVGFRTPVHEAEKIKRKYGCAMSDLLENDEKIEVPSVGGRKSRVLSRRVLSDIIEPRAEEIFSLVSQEVKNTGYKDFIAAGVVLTGGAVIMDGMAEIAEQIMQLPVRRGTRGGVGGLMDVVNSPMYATGVGLVLHGAKNQGKPGRFGKSHEGNVFEKILARMKEWLGDYF
jgi:cell division protein FtsA